MYVDGICAHYICFRPIYLLHARQMHNRRFRRRLNVKFMSVVVIEAHCKLLAQSFAQNSKSITLIQV